MTAAVTFGRMRSSRDHTRGNKRRLSFLGTANVFQEGYFHLNGENECSSLLAAPPSLVTQEVGDGDRVRAWEGLGRALVLVLAPGGSPKARLG